MGDERFWQNAIKVHNPGGVMVCFGEERKMKESFDQIELFRRAAIDGKKDRFRSEKCEEKLRQSAADAAADRARKGQEVAKLRASSKQLTRQQKYDFGLDMNSAVHVCDLPQDY